MHSLHINTSSTSNLLPELSNISMINPHCCTARLLWQQQTPLHVVTALPIHRFWCELHCSAAMQQL
jgi:hypothetical protein